MKVYIVTGDENYIYYIASTREKAIKYIKGKLEEILKESPHMEEYYKICGYLGEFDIKEYKVH